MAKNNNLCKVWKILKLFGAIGGILVAAGIAYGVLNQRVTNHGKTLIKHGNKIDKHETAVIRMGSDIHYIKEDVAKQTVILEDIQKELRK